MRGGAICLERDISKAFDKLQWSFPFRALKIFKFSEKWIGLIQKLICTSKGWVLVKNSPGGFFCSSCGLRQVHPLPPYQFILAKEILSLNLQSLQGQDLVHPVSTTATSLCHLFFADDIMLFMKATERSLAVMKSLLTEYQVASR